MQRVLFIYCIIHKVSLLFSALYATCPYYVLLNMKSILIMYGSDALLQTEESKAEMKAEAESKATIKNGRIIKYSCMTHLQTRPR